MSTFIPAFKVEVRSDNGAKLSATPAWDDPKTFAVSLNGSVPVAFNAAAAADAVEFFGRLKAKLEAGS